MSSCASDIRGVEAENRAETAFVEAASELHEALIAKAPESVLRALVASYDAAFDCWVGACELDLSRSSFEQQAD